MIIHRYESTQEEVRNTNGPVIFLAGPTVRGHQLHLTSWRFEAIEIFKKLGFKGSLIIPESIDQAFDDRDKSWIPDWEYNGLKRADCNMFWIPRTRELIGLTTNWEQGYWIGRKLSKVTYGRPDDFYRNGYPDFMWNKIHKEILNKTTNEITINIITKHSRIYNTLESTIIASIQLAEKFANQREISIYYTGSAPDDSAIF